MSNENPKWMPKQRFWTDDERNRLVREHGEMAALLERIALTPMQNAAHALDYIEEARALLAKIKGE